MSSSARWGGLRPDPYNPDAFDADGDGIVQEGTAFERPAGTRIVDEFGRDIRPGSTSDTRPSNWRVVDKDGNDVPYIPTYQRTRSQPVSNFVGTIGSRVGTVGDRVGTIGDRVQPLESSVGTIINLPGSSPTQAAPQPAMEIPEYSPLIETIEDYNLPVVPGLIIPDEMRQEPNMEKVSELIDKIDDANQLVPRAIASAFYTQDFSWIVDQFAFDAAGYASLGGDPDPVEGLTLADIAYVAQALREDAQASVRRVADENGMVRVYRGGEIRGIDEPVSVSLNREDAEQFGDVFEYLAPVSAFEFQPSGGSYADEFLVNPRLMERVDDISPNVLASTFDELTIDFDDFTERANIENQVRAIQLSLLRALKDTLGQDADQFVDTSNLAGLDGELVLFPSSYDNDWIDSVADFVARANITEEQRAALNVLIQDNRLKGELDDIQRYTIRPSATPIDPFADTSLSINPFADQTANTGTQIDPFTGEPIGLSAPIDPLTGEPYALISNDGDLIESDESDLPAFPEPQYDLDEARSRYMEILSQLSPNRQDSIRQSVDSLRRTKEEEIRQQMRDRIRDELDASSAEEVAKTQLIGQRIPMSPREYNPASGSALVGMRDREASDLISDPNSSRSVEDIRRDADSVLVRAGDLTLAEHEDELIDLLMLDEVSDRASAFYDANLESGVGEVNGRQFLDAITAFLIEQRKFDGDAMTVTSDEIDNLIASGYREMSRGGARYPNQQFISGEMLIGTGIDGAGLYFASETVRPGDVKNGWESIFQSTMYARMSSDGGTILRGILNPSAKIADLEFIGRALRNYYNHMKGDQITEGPTELSDLRSRLAAKAETDPSAYEALVVLDSILTSRSGQVNNSMGFAALLMGFDGIEDGESTNRTIIYNRSAIITGDSLLSPDQYDALRGWDAFKDRYNPILIARGDLPIDPTPQQIRDWREAQVDKILSELDSEKARMLG